MSDHITECPACYIEIRIPCSEVALADRLRAEGAAMKHLKQLAAEARAARRNMRSSPFADILAFERLADAIDALPDDGVVVPRAQLERWKTSLRELVGTHGEPCAGAGCFARPRGAKAADDIAALLKGPA